MYVFPALGTVFSLNRYDMNTTLRHLFGNKEMFKHSFLLSQFVNTLDLMSHRTGLPAYNYLRLDDKLRRDNIIEYDRNYSLVRYAISIWFYSSHFFLESISVIYSINRCSMYMYIPVHLFCHFCIYI